MSVCILLYLRLIYNRLYFFVNLSINLILPPVIFISILFAGIIPTLQFAGALKERFTVFDPTTVIGAVIILTASGLCLWTVLYLAGMNVPSPLILITDEQKTTHDKCAYRITPITDFLIKASEMESDGIIEAYLEQEAVMLRFGSLKDFRKHLTERHSYASVTWLGNPGLCPEVVYVKVFNRISTSK